LQGLYPQIILVLMLSPCSVIIVHLPKPDASFPDWVMSRFSINGPKATNPTPPSCTGETFLCTLCATTDLTSSSPRRNNLFQPLPFCLCFRFWRCSTIPTISATHSCIRSFILSSFLLPPIRLGKLLTFSYINRMTPSGFRPGIIPCTLKISSDTPVISNFYCCSASRNSIGDVSIVPVSSTSQLCLSINNTSLFPLRRRSAQRSNNCNIVSCFVVFRWPVCSARYFLPSLLIISKILHDSSFFLNIDDLCRLFCPRAEVPAALRELRTFPSVPLPKSLYAWECASPPAITVGRRVSVIRSQLVLNHQHSPSEIRYSRRHLRVTGYCPSPLCCGYQ